MTPISAENLLLSFDKIESIFTIEGKIVNTKLVITSANYTCLGLIFKNCEFILDVFFKKVNLKCGVKFINCTFKKNLIFDNTTINKYDHEFNFENDSILIQKCVISEKLIFQNRNNILRDTCLDNSQFGSIDIYNIGSKEGSLQIRNTILNSHSHISQNEFINDIHFSKTIAKGSLRFENNDTSDYAFIKNTFEADAWIWYGKVLRGITFNEGVYHGSFRIQSIQSNGNLAIYGSKFESEFLVEYESNNGNDNIIGGCPRINIGDSEFNNGLILTGRINRNFLHEIEKINIDTTKKLKGEISFSGFDIKSLKITGNNYDSNIIFDNNSFVSVLFERFTNFGTVQFNNARASSRADEPKVFSFLNSHLGKTLFTNVSFEKFDTVSINNSNFTEITASNVIWFELNQLDVPDGLDDTKNLQTLWKSIKFLIYNVESSDDKLQHYRRKRELFRQLKHSMQQQGNQIQSLVFKQYEMNFFTQEMRLSRKVYDKDRLIMEFSRTNSHGQNWIKPLIWLLGLTVLFGFWLFVIFSPDLTSTISFKAADIKFTFSEFWYNKKIITQILNPTHSLSDIFGNKISFSGWLHGVDILYRVIYAFFVFQIIAAFRKFIK